MPGIDVTLWVNPGPAGDRDAVFHQIEVVDGVGVGVDRKGNAERDRPAGIHLVQIEAGRVSIDFEGDAGLFSGGKHGFPIQIGAFAVG